MNFWGRLLSWVGRNKTKSNLPDVGVWGEQQACLYLQKRGYTLLGCRVRIGRRDEIDLVMKTDRILVFVEVKTRKSEAFGRPLSAVKKGKRKALSRAAIHYLKKLRYPRINFRFDVIEVIGSPDLKTPPEIRHIENAFPLEGRYFLP